MFRHRISADDHANVNAVIEDLRSRLDRSKVDPRARVLAIAEGLPLVRAANTGISAVVDPVGRIINSLPLGIEGVLDARLPAAIEPTPYVRYGNYFLGSVLIVSLLVVGRRRFRA